ncbi:MAG TPA: DUF58 domain-containing protein [Gemmataceae bacterium]|jgi:uncharacterized protein (DUF58 family)|nr:DUF58 domain-containing protein [Gemmataceae bacterium]
MLTSRGWWLFVVALFFAGIGTIWSLTPVGSQPRGATLAIIGLTLVLAIAAEWIRFLVCLRLGRPHIRVEREVRDERGPVVTLWAGRSFEVIVRVSCASRVPVPFVLIDDRFPFGVELSEGGTNAGGWISRGRSSEVRYRIRCQTPGPVRFEGVRLRFVDLQGLIYHETFIRQPLVYPVLPSLVDAEANQRTNKRHNLLPPPGIHRLRRPGSGSELLDLRDYRPGDPPKMIAWKASARKDKLITKEFESEVPVRCTLFVDVSQAVRLGPPGKNALARLIELSSAVAQAALANRDNVGLAMFDEADSSALRPARGQRHLVELLRHLAEAARLPPSSSAADLEALLPIAYAFAQEVYPDLLNPEVNSFRWWIPILFPRPEYLRKLTLTDAVLPWWRRILISEWQHQTMRKRLAAVLAWREGYAPGGLALMLEDDQFFADAMQHFLADHHVPHPVPLYDWRGRYLFRSDQKVNVLAAALLRSVRRGQDNELFVLQADLLDMNDRLEPLLRAIRVAMGRHHRLMLIVPWMPGIPPPGEVIPVTERHTMLGWLRSATIQRYHDSFEHLRRELGRVGVPVICAEQGQPVHLILERMDQLRVAGITR